MPPLRLFLVNDQVLVRESVARLLQAEADFDVVGQSGFSPKVLQELQSSQADIVLVDCDPTMERAYELLESARPSADSGRFFLLAGEMNEGNVRQAIRLGAAGVILKQASFDVLLRAIRAVGAGEMWLDQKLIHLLAAGVRYNRESYYLQLSEREGRVLDGVMEGFTNRKIADSLGLTEASVKATLQDLFQKLRVRTRAQLVRAALEANTK